MKLKCLIKGYLITLCLCLCQAYALPLRPELVMDNFDDVIWSLEFLNENEALISLRGGKLFHVNLKDNTRQEIQGVPEVASGGQGGLLDLALHPRFAKNQFLYMTFSEAVQGGKTTSLARGKLNLKLKRLENLEILFRAVPAYSTSHHFGSRLAFDSKGHLFISIGDRGNRDYAQDLARHNGKVLRLDDNGKAAKGNPYLRQKRAKGEIWSYGHRNPQGMVYDTDTDQLWIHEHGPRGGDEINLIRKANNYGWPIITYGREYTGPKIGDGITEKVGMKQPHKYYVPSIAPSGLELFHSTNQKSLFIGALALTHLNQVRVAKSGAISNEKRHFESLGERIRDVRKTPSGKTLYFSTDSGRIYRIKDL